MSTIQGQVAVCTRNRYGYGMKVEGQDQWFNSKQEINCSKGDMVEFSSGTDGKSVYDLKVTGAGSSGGTSSGGSGSGGGNSGGSHDKRQTSIVRQNAVTNANAFFFNTKNTKYNMGDLLKAAKFIALYTEGNPLPPTDAEVKVAAEKAAEAEKAAAAEASATEATDQQTVQEAMAAMEAIPF